MLENLLISMEDKQRHLAVAGWTRMRDTVTYGQRTGTDIEKNSGLFGFRITVVLENKILQFRF